MEIFRVTWATVLRQITTKGNATMGQRALNSDGTMVVPIAMERIELYRLILKMETASAANSSE